MASSSAGRIALLSIRPKFAKLIMKGKKKVEFRRTRFGKKVSHIVVYASSPVQKIIGYFEVSHIQEGSPQELWSHYGKVGGASQKEFRAYYALSAQGVAIGVGKICVLQNPLPLTALCNSLTPPQSFTYLNDDIFEMIQDHA